MITLAQAFKLFEWQKYPEVIYLRHHKDKSINAEFFSTVKLLKYADLKAIKVYHIGEHFTYNNDPKSVELAINWRHDDLLKLQRHIIKAEMKGI